MSLFDEPVSAHIGEDAVLWVGVVEKGNEGSPPTTTAIVVTAKGRVGLAPIQELTADWRWVPDRVPYRDGTDGPGWVDLEEIQRAGGPSIPVDMDAAKAAVVEALTKDEPAKDLVEGRDYLLSSDGTKFDPSTNLPIDE